MKMSTKNKKDEVITFKATKEFKEKIKNKAGQLGISVAEYLTDNIEESINKDINIEKGFSKVEDKMIEQFIHLIDKFEDFKSEIKDEKHNEIKELLTKNKKVLTDINIDKTKKEEYKIGDLLYIENGNIYVVEALLEENFLGLRNISNNKTTHLNVSEDGSKFIKIKRLL
jgi:hypothetical protein